MKAIIYEVINLYNQSNGILPYRYVGSDQHNNSKYLGSNKELKEDIKRLGVDNFKKIILFEYDSNMSNIELRKLESEYQQGIDAANDPSYYNKTNFSHKGYIETEEAKSVRMAKTHNAYRIWWDNLSEDEKLNHKLKASHKGANNGMKGKTFEEIYGKERSKEQRLKYSGKNNGMSKRVMDISTGKIFNTMIEAMTYYNIKKYETLRNKCLIEKEMKFI